MAKVARFDGIDMIVRTRDEHCEPHVHVMHDGEGWELRIFFSFISTTVDVDVLSVRKALPKARVIQACMNKLVDELDIARKLFWAATQKVCLDNKFVQIMDGTIYAALSNSPGALRVSAARYLVRSKSISFTAHGQSAALRAKCP